jgi:predicted phage gp36 major capsid-like protein
MPRYFFHTQDGGTYTDRLGVELSGPGEARSKAIESAGEAIKDELRDMWSSGEWRMQVIDEDGETVCALQFSADKIDYRPRTSDLPQRARKKRLSANRTAGAP